MAYNNTPKAATPKPTPAPVTKEHTYGRTSYGANAYAGPSSVEPGRTITSPLADSLRDAQNDGKDILGDVIARGACGDPGKQTRTVSAEPLPTTRGMSGASPGGKVPGAIDKTAEAPLPSRTK